MKNKIRITNIICIMIITILLLATNVFAVNDSFKTSLSTSSSTVKRGEEVTITISLKDISIESGEKGIGAYSANIEFDSSVLEFSKATGTDNWEAPFYQDKMIVGNTNNGQVVKTNQDIGSITFKVKENATLGETTIKLAKFSGSSVANDIDVEDTTIKINVIDKNASGNNEDPNGSGSGNTSNNQNGNETTNGGNQSGNQDENSNNGVNQNGNSNNQNGSTNNGNSNDGTQNGNNNNGNENGSNGNSNGKGTNVKNYNNINDAPKDGIPQTGDKNITLYILISIFTLISIIILIRIKVINKNIKKNI